METIVLGVILGINVLAFILMGVDKYLAINNRYRISEFVLLGVAFAFGSLGTYIGMSLFHHKNQKIKFRVTNSIFLFIHMILAVVYVIIQKS